MQPASGQNTQFSWTGRQGWGHTGQTSCTSRKRIRKDTQQDCELCRLLQRDGKVKQAL